MRSLSESLANTFKCKMHESDMGIQSIQKVLRLFGYPNATNQRYICCLSLEPRMDVHKYQIGSSMFLMCMITANNKVIDSALWSLPLSVWSSIKNTDLFGCTSIDDIDSALAKLSDNNYTFVMRYCPN